MKLDHPFIQLPLLFDADVLAAEVAALGEAPWMPHPQQFAGNSMLPLVASGGDPADESFAGRMRPTPHLRRCPYLGEVIASLGAVVGRTRLMRLSGHAEVALHADQGYYWSDRVRVHVPITTHPTVRFECGDAAVHMGRGECWIFDTWRLHRVANEDPRERIHLVVDTVGGGPFWERVRRGRTHEGRALGAGWAPERVPPGAPGLRPARFESANLPVVMTPWELSDRLDFLFAEAVPHASLGPARGLTQAFVARWRQLWAEHGDHADGWPAYRQAANTYLAHLERIAGQARLRNDIAFVGAVTAIVGQVATSGWAAKPHYFPAAAHGEAGNEGTGPAAGLGATG